MDSTFRHGHSGIYGDEYKERLEEDNPYGVPIGRGNWAGGGMTLSFGTTVT